jgi:hypothetical protein
MIIIKTIFCPDSDNLLSFEKSILELYYFLDGNNIIPQKIILIGYYKPCFKSFFVQLLKLREFNIEIINYSINYGKYYYFNIIGNMNLSNDIFVWYLDHDIYPSNITQLNIISDVLNDNKDIGIFALNQQGDCRHQYSAFLNFRKLGTLNLSCSEDNDYGSIALGSFFILSNKLKLFIKLRKRAVYGLDDLEIIKLLCDSKYKNYILYDKYVYHPYDLNIEYKKWKLDIVQNLLLKNISYDRSIQKAVNFWSDKN